MAGRKSKFEELQIVERYAELSEPFFATLKEFLASNSKEDKKFAIEQLGKAFPKMIPTQLTGLNGAAIQVQVLTAEQVAALDKLTLPNVDQASSEQSNNGDASGTPLPLQ